GWAPSWNAPTSKETRVRVELLEKRSPTLRPASGRSPFGECLRWAACARVAASSSRVRSETVRKSRLVVNAVEPSRVSIWQQECSMTAFNPAAFAALVALVGLVILAAGLLSGGVERLGVPMVALFLG